MPPWISWICHTHFHNPWMAETTFAANCHLLFNSIFSVGPVATDLLRHWPGTFGRLLRFTSKLIFQKPEVAARTICHLACDASANSSGGSLFSWPKSSNIDSSHCVPRNTQHLTMIRKPHTTCKRHDVCFVLGEQKKISRKRKLHKILSKGTECEWCSNCLHWFCF